MSLDQSQQVFALERLCDVIVTPAGEDFPSVTRHRERRGGNDRNGPGLLVSFEPARYFHA